MLNPRLNLIVYGACGYAVALVVQYLLTPWDGNGLSTLVPYLATPILMMAFGPYPLVPGDAWIGSGNWWWLLKILPLYLTHLAFFWGLLRRPGWVPRKTPTGNRRRIIEMGLVACWSALGIWFAVPTVEYHELVCGDKLTGSPVRLAIVSDLHSCRYGEGQKGLVEMIESGRPDIVLMVGDILDDRLPDEPAHAFVQDMVRRYPCVYVTGNHEFWSDRVCSMKMWMQKVGVSVLQADCKTIMLKDNEIEFCGVDDPTEMVDEYWRGLLDQVWKKSTRTHLRILLTHRPEYPEVYAKYDYDLVLAGHAHGGQWRCPFIDFCLYSPDQHFSPKYSSGFYRLANGTLMFVTRGLARESAPIPRFFNHPEVVFVDLVKEVAK